MRKNSNDWFIQYITISSIVYGVLLLVIGITGTICTPIEDRNPKTGIDPQTALTEYVKKVSEINGVRPEVVLAIIGRESNFQPDVTNPDSGCAGLMQLAPCTLDWLEQETGCRYDPYDPFQNVAGGVYLLGWLYDRYDGNEPMALLAYAQGTGGAEQMIGEGVNPVDTWQVRTIYDRLSKGV